MPSATLDIKTIKLGDELYPPKLSQIPDAPATLYVLGDPKALRAERLVAIVGTRKPTDYGIRSATHLARQLSSDMAIVSGLAYGVDTVALAEAVSVGAVPVIAVTGSGLDRESFYPQSNWGLAMKIIEGGGVILSEYPPGTPPLRHHFPARNRIIAGLSDGVIVIEAGEGSGALITANLALDYNREVMALAGSIFINEAQGVNRLIRDGAALITEVSDVFDALGISRINDHTSSSVKAGESTEEYDLIADLLNERALSVDEIAKMAKLDSAKVSSTLTLMEIRGIVKQTGAGKYARLK